MSCRLLRWEKGYYEENHSKLLTLVCLLAALMGLSAVTAHAETISGTISGGRNYHYYEDKSNVPQWGPFGAPFRVGATKPYTYIIPLAAPHLKDVPH